jgi:hypothetical protein
MTMKGKDVRQDNGKRVTRDEIEAAKTASGGWTRERLAAWGVAWPPPKGWKNELLSRNDAGKSEDWQC